MSPAAFKLAVELLGALVSAVIAAGVVEWIKRWLQKQPAPMPTVPKRWFLHIFVGVIVGAVVFLVINAAWKVGPRVAITAPSDSLDVTAEGSSVWFPVSGTSSRVVFDNSLKLYVLVHSGTEWQIQRPASVEPNGNWTLERAWIGDATAPVREGSRLRISAAVSRQHRAQDEKVQDPRELDPQAMSSTVVATVRKIRLLTKP